MTTQWGVGGGGIVHVVDVCPFTSAWSPPLPLSSRRIVLAAWSRISLNNEYIVTVVLGAAKRMVDKRDKSVLSAHIIAILAI